MRPLTYLAPKCMLPVGGKPLLERTIGHLREHGITEFVICVAYLRRQITEHFGDGSRFDVAIEFAESELPLGTAGQLKTAERFIDGTFVAMNGDIVTSINVKNLLDAHRRGQCFATLALKTFEVKVPYGCINVDTGSQITSFEEKPTFRFLANAGVYILERPIFEHIPGDRPSSLETEVFPSLIKGGKRLIGYYEEAYWADVGSLVDFERVDNELIEAHRAGLGPRG